jgi:hypothetical protein
MLCEHCNNHFHGEWQIEVVGQNARHLGIARVRFVRCAACKRFTVDATVFDTAGASSKDWFRLSPLPTNAAHKAPPEVPQEIGEVHVEAHAVLPVSARASAALSRRCLQQILRERGYYANDLKAEIEQLLNETDATRALPASLRETIDAIRNFGNFSAHPITETTSLQVIDVEPHEAEWCLDILDDLFEHFYVKLAEARKRKEALNAKLEAAGKPPAL